MDPEKLHLAYELAASLGVEPQTIAKWQRLGLFPEPKECRSDRPSTIGTKSVLRSSGGRRRCAAASPRRVKRSLLP